MFVNGMLVAGHIPVGRPAASLPPSVMGSTHSRRTHRSGGGGAGGHAAVEEGVDALGMRSRSRDGSVSSSGTYRSGSIGGGSRSGSGSGNNRRRRGRGGDRLDRVSEASGEGG